MLVTGKLGGVDPPGVLGFFCLAAAPIVNDVGPEPEPEPEPGVEVGGETPYDWRMRRDRELATRREEREDEEMLVVMLALLATE